EHDRAHADQYAVFDGAAVQHAAVPDGHVVADHRRHSVRRRRVRAGDVDDGAVLNARARADADRADVAANHHHGPDGAVRADDDVADDDRHVVDVRSGINDRSLVQNGANGHGSRFLKYLMTTTTCRRQDDAVIPRLWREPP